VVREVLARRPASSRGWLLAYLEQRAIREADLEVLREVRAFKAQREADHMT
jgi:hypothetical protein